MSTVCVLQQPSAADGAASPQTMKIPSSSDAEKSPLPTPTKNNMMMFSVISPKNSPIPLKYSSLSNSAPCYLPSTHQLPRLSSSCSDSSGGGDNNEQQRNNSYYSVSNNIIQKHGHPLRSSMSSRTLHESLHRGCRSSSASQDMNSDDGSSNPHPVMMKRSVSFSQVNIREYERVRGPKNSSTLGPPLSIGWRYAEQLISLNVDEYENNKGPRRCSAEFLVPKHVRERILKEHTAASQDDNNKGEDVDISSHRATRRRSSTTFPSIEDIDDNEEEDNNNNKKDKKVTMKSSLHKLKKMLKPTSLARIPPYEEREAQLWNDAHLIALAKAKKLEESIKRGENISCIDLYSVGTPCNNILPSRRNSVNIPIQEARMVKNSLLMDGGDNKQSSGGAGRLEMESRKASAPDVVGELLKKHPSGEIVVTENDGDDDEELRLAKLLSDDAAI